MLLINEGNASTIKEFNFMLWSFLEARVDLPMEKSLKLFGRHTTFRYCSNIDLENLASQKLAYEYRKLLCDNPNVSNRDIYKHLGDGGIFPLQNAWQSLLAKYEGKGIADSIKESSHKLRPVPSTYENFHKALKEIKEQAPDELLNTVRTLFSLPAYCDTPQVILSTISGRYNPCVLDAMVFTEDQIKELIEAKFYRKPRVCSLIIANGGVDIWANREGLTFDNTAMSINDGFNLGLDIKPYLTDWRLWEHPSVYTPITQGCDAEVIEAVFKSTNPERYSYLGNFDKNIQVEIIRELIKDPSLDESSVNHLCHCLLSLTRYDLPFCDELSEYLVGWALGQNEQRYFWKLYLADNIPEYLKGPVRVQLATIIR